MPEFFDYDPVTGLRYDYSFNEETGEASIHTTQDVESVLDYTKALANDGLTDGGIKKGWWLYAKIPPIVQLAMRGKGIKLDDPQATKRIIAEINAHYPHLKCTQKHDEGQKLVMVHDLGRRSEG